MPYITPPPAQDKREMWELDPEKDLGYKAWLTENGADFLLDADIEEEKEESCQ